MSAPTTSRPRTCPGCWMSPTLTDEAGRCLVCNTPEDDPMITVGGMIRVGERFVPFRIDGAGLSLTGDVPADVLRVLVEAADQLGSAVSLTPPAGRGGQFCPVGDCQLGPGHAGEHVSDIWHQD